MNTVHPLWLEVFVDLWDPTVNQIANVLTLETFVSLVYYLFIYTISYTCLLELPDAT